VCGIAGCWEFERGRSYGNLEAIVARMTATLAHRGPDGEGLWIDEQAGIALGHRRLAIVDPSDAGRQPMVSPDRRYVFMVNGELYNFLELRAELAREGAEFTGNSDAEVMLQAVVRWGLDRALDRFIGMFAIALWDATHRILHLVRDRIGEKPLYYGQWNGAFVFASELKALRAHPGFEASTLMRCRSCVTAYRRHTVNLPDIRKAPAADRDQAG
jgi:asparagine synthase (glutamine-hydrolysing)